VGSERSPVVGDDDVGGVVAGLVLERVFELAEQQGRHDGRLLGFGGVFAGDRGADADWMLVADAERDGSRPGIRSGEQPGSRNVRTTRPDT